MIVLTGFMGSGKSTTGARLAERLGTELIDTDHEIEAESGSSIRTLFQDRGEAGFRAIEAEVVRRSVARGPGVLALGGGALTDPGTRGLIERADALVVHLDVSFSRARERVGSDPKRPLLTGDPEGLHRSRDRGYRAAAAFSVATDDLDPSGAAARVAELASLNRVDLVTSAGRAAMVIGDDVSWSAAHVPEVGAAERLFLVTHPSLTAHAEKVQRAIQKVVPVTTFTVPEGEQSKSPDEAVHLYRRLAGAGAHRHDVMAAVGGGVVTDLTGFVASTYNRGMPVVHVPTTLLGMVDAAIGGKTGIDLPEGKNLIGTFHQPSGVIADVSVLETLPEEELRAGLAEVIKYGFIADPGILEVVTEGSALRHEMVHRSAAIKASIVASDEFDRGRREILNYGHTFAHGIEALGGYGGIRHGEAVAIGMMAAAHLAHVMGRIDADLVDEHRRILDAVRLPVRANISREDLEATWVRDKKYRGGVRFVLLSELGVAESGVRAEAEEIDEALERLAR